MRLPVNPENLGQKLSPILLRAAAMGVLLVVPAAAQWLNLSTPGLPRTPDGKPNLTAPPPRAADGHPDLSGLWEPNANHFLRDIAVDLKPGSVPFQPWAEALYKERLAGLHSKEESDANCLPQGVPKIDAAPAPFKIFQTPDEVAVLHEAFNLWRQIFLDGRKLAKDANPNWLGYSLGHWDGDTLVVETTGFNGKTWLDQVGHPATESLHVTERFRRKDFGHIALQITIDDPKAYTKPWTVDEELKLMVDSELIEFICNENNRDVAHLLGN
jgi:hypothetical protein